RDTPQSRHHDSFSHWDTIGVALLIGEDDAGRDAVALPECAAAGGDGWSADVVPSWFQSYHYERGESNPA
ncbi:MAG TPA: hypothetical protein VGC20_09765, partial [bacterium]